MAEMDTEIGVFASEDSHALATEMLNHTGVAMSRDFQKSVIVVGSTSGSLNSENPGGSNSDLSCHNDNNTDDAIDDDEDGCDYDEDGGDYMYDNDDDHDDDDDDDDDDDYLRMQAQFDSVSLPSGVEAPVSWLEDPASGVNAPSSPATGKKQEAKEEEQEDQVLRKFQLFKMFDTVDDFSDHHFNCVGFSGQQAPKAWAKKIQEEWQIMEKDLPDTIYVRGYETRMDLLRAIIVGPAGTPYHDGLFVFDVLFPPTYPDVPPMVYYYSGGLRINPNLYDCGKVCLSLLNTWSGKEDEMWMPKKSTMLQVLVSIQALILNAQPFFNEPGTANMEGTEFGKQRSKAYNENVFLLSLKTMVYTLRRPPKHFEEFVAGHFRLRAHDILSACKAYAEGAEIGSVVKGRVEDIVKAKTNRHSEFQTAVAKMMNGLVTYFVKNGSKDCKKFLIPC